MTVSLHWYQRPGGSVAAAIVEIAQLLTEHWFTANVPEDIGENGAVELVKQL